jgi:hypothetical protein
MIDDVRTWLRDRGTQDAPGAGCSAADAYQRPARRSRHERPSGS